MALYTPPTPSILCPLPAELLAPWSTTSRPSRPSSLPTPPMSAALPRLLPQPHPCVTSLPPIAYFDRQLSTMHPVTPPQSRDASSWSRSAPRPTHQPSPDMLDDDVLQQPFQQEPVSPRDASHFIDWFDISLKRPTSFVAEKTCEMVCYLWFSSSVPASARPRSQMPSPPLSPDAPLSSSPLQFNPSPTFVQFMQKLLETTQVSQSVIVLSLHYIWRLKERNRFTSGLPGSEFRIAVAALMMANKFLDDNTYTNKTWSEVSGIDLSEINRMEREFLMGVDFALYVSGKKYESWLNLLKGLVLAKESEGQKWRRSRTRYRNGRRLQPAASTPAMRTTRSRCHSTTYRARSTSPLQYVHPHCSTNVTTRPHLHVNLPPSPSPNPGSKRSAADAFSPTSTSFNELPPLKRPTGMTLHIPENGFLAGSSSASPLEPLQSFAKMSLSASSPHHARTASSVQPLHENRPQTLVAAYRIDRPVNVPQNLYYYSLAGSSIDTEAEHERVQRKARLRCFRPPMTTSYPPPPPYMPIDIQSASVSPQSHLSVRQVPLPHIKDAIWSRKLQLPPYISPADNSLQLPPLRENVVPSAPFANAGPPGVHFYASSSQRGSPVYPYNWTYGR
ncbi:cyclin-domain-containing protein [Butyriboletus roseoflavus]|nr:cyclin-domain-containing protein [Butyriboletus roseoflavus]